MTAPLLGKPSESRRPGLATRYMASARDGGIHRRLRGHPRLCSSHCGRGCRRARYRRRRHLSRKNGDVRGRQARRLGPLGRRCRSAGVICDAHGSWRVIRGRARRRCFSDNAYARAPRPRTRPRAGATAATRSCGHTATASTRWQPDRHDHPAGDGHLPLRRARPADRGLLVTEHLSGRPPAAPLPCLAASAAC